MLGRDMSEKILCKWMVELRLQTRQQTCFFHTFYRANRSLHTMLQESQRLDQRETWNGLGRTRGKSRQ